MHVAGALSSGGSGGGGKMALTIFETCATQRWYGKLRRVLVEEYAGVRFDLFEKSTPSRRYPNQSS